MTPVKDAKVTSPYGWRTLNGKKQFHDGIDFVSTTGDNTVRAIADGKVCYDVDYYEESKRWTDKRHSAGNYLIIKHAINGKTYYGRYFHLGENYVSNGDVVVEGQAIGYYADAGISYGAHLHFDIYDDKWKKLNPTEFV